MAEGAVASGGGPPPPAPYSNAPMSSAPSSERGLLCKSNTYWLVGVRSYPVSEGPGGTPAFRTVSGEDDVRW